MQGPPTQPETEAVQRTVNTLAGSFVVHASRVHNVQPGRLHHKAQTSAITPISMNGLPDRESSIEYRASGGWVGRMARNGKRVFRPSTTLAVKPSHPKLK